MNIAPQELEQMFGELPQEIAQDLLSSSTTEVITELAERYKLPDGGKYLRQHCIILLSAKEDADDCIQDFTQMYNMTENQAEALYVDLDEQILQTNRENIGKMMRGEELAFSANIPAPSVAPQSNKFNSAQQNPPRPENLYLKRQTEGYTEPNTRDRVLDEIENPEPNALTKQIQQDHHEDPFPMVVKPEPPQNLPTANAVPINTNRANSPYSPYQVAKPEVPQAPQQASRPAQFQPSTQPVQPSQPQQNQPPRPQTPAQPQNFLDSKLSSTTHIEHKEENMGPKPQSNPNQPKYTGGTDPYREPLG